MKQELICIGSEGHFVWKAYGVIGKVRVIGIKLNRGFVLQVGSN